MKKKLAMIMTVLLLVVLSMTIIACDKNTGSISDDTKNQDAIEEEKPFTIGFISDPHVIDQSEIYDDECKGLASYVYEGQRLLALSQSILQTVVDKYIEDKVNCVLICGDLSETGSRTSLEAVAKECKRLEDAGISVYIADGYADIENYAVRFDEKEQVPTSYVTKSEFKEIFGAYGFDEAIVSRSDNLSYVCDIPGTNLRLLNLSTNFHYLDRILDEEAMPTLNEEDLDWIEQVLIQAQKDKKEVFVMTYYPVSDQLGKNFGSVFKTYSVKLQNSDVASQLFTGYGVKYVMNGHMHMLNETEYTDDYGATFTSLSSGCLSNYPMNYNYVYYKDGVWSRETKFLSAIDEKYIPDYIDDTLKEKVTTDLLAYSPTYLYKDIHARLDYLMSKSYGRKASLFLEYMYRLNFYEEHKNPPEKVVEIAEDFLDIFWRFFDLPIYIENETAENPESVERYMQKYDITLPETDYTTFSDWLIKNFCAIYRNEENLKSDSDNVKILTYCGYSLFEMIVDFDPFARIIELKPEVTYIDWRPIHEKVIREGIFDMKQDDAILRLIEIGSLALESRLGHPIKLNNVDDLLDLVKVLLPGTLAILFTEDYDPDAETIGGIAYTKYIDLNKGIINLRLLMEEIFFDLWLKELLN